MQRKFERPPVAAATIRVALLAAAAVSLVSACAPRPETVAEASAADEAHPGKAAYDQWCASCHDNAEESRAPSLEAIRSLNRANIRYALELGYMKQQAKDVPADELEQLIDWLPTQEQANDSWIEDNRCPIKQRKVRLDGLTSPTASFGIGYDSLRSLSADDAGLAKSDMKDLELAWSIAFPATPTMRSQPVVVGSTLFIAATDAGRLFALDADTGCVKWAYVSDMTLRSSLSYAPATETTPAAIVMGDAGGKVHAVAAETGKALWVRDVKLTDVNRITGAPIVYDGRVFAPISAIEVNYTNDDAYECCIGQGAMAALDLATGEPLWVGRTMPDATPQLISRTGVQQWGPSGAIIWSTPVIDPRRNVLYAGTGENTSWPATDTSDAILAYDLDTGAVRWGFQATRADIWNYACGRRGANCDWPGEYHSPDHDFGATSMLVSRSDGKQLVIAGQKSGVIWALDPDDGGRLVWSNRVGRGSANGGVHWGMAFDGQRIFAPLNDPGGSPDNPNWGPGLHAINVDTGEIEWSYKPNARDCGADAPIAVATRPAPEWRKLEVAAPMMPQPRPAPRPAAVQTSQAPGAAAQAGAPPRPAMRCRLGMSPAPLLVDGAVVTGTTQGMLRIFDNVTGEVLFEYQTNRPYPDTVNGVEGHGGGLDSAPYIAARGTLYVQSGYARFGQPPGNMLLAFRPKRD